MDDWGYRLLKRSGEKGPLAAAGHLLLWLMPLVIKLLRLVGTVALLLVSGDIFIHNIEYLHHVLPQLPAILRELLAGLAAGLIGFSIVAGLKAGIRQLKRPN